MGQPYKQMRDLLVLIRGHRLVVVASDADIKDTASMA